MLSDKRQNKAQNSNRDLSLLANKKSYQTETKITANIVENDMNTLDPAVQLMAKLVENVAKQITSNPCVSPERKQE